MKYRMVKVSVANGERVWFEAEYKRFLFWLPCFTKGISGWSIQYPTWEAAADALRRHKSLYGHVTRTVVRNW